MPITKSAHKALRQSTRRRVQNTQRKIVVKKAVKDLRKLVAEKKEKEAREALVRVYAIADKIAKTKFIKKNKANRIKSRAAKLLKKEFEKKAA